MKKVLVLAVAVGLSLWGNAFAANITIPDENASGGGWYGPQEDQEVEPGCITGQQWDLEAWYMSGNTLTAVGGYNFITGVSGWNSAAGDIFVDIDGDAQWGVGAHKPTQYPPDSTVSDTFGYDFVLDMDYSAMTYTVVDISSAGAALRLKNVTEAINWGSNPWRYVSGGLVTGYGGTIGYNTYANDALALAAGYDVTGGWHNAISVDLSWLANYEPETLIVHITQQCGNDDLMGQVPEPSTIVLISLGLGGLLLRRKVRA